MVVTQKVLCHCTYHYSTSALCSCCRKSTFQNVGVRCDLVFCRIFDKGFIVRSPTYFPIRRITRGTRIENYRWFWALQLSPSTGHISVTWCVRIKQYYSRRCALMLFVHDSDVVRKRHTLEGNITIIQLIPTKIKCIIKIYRCWWKICAQILKVFVSVCRVSMETHGVWNKISHVSRLSK